MPEARRSRTGSRTPRSSGSTAGATEFGKRNANGPGQKINLARRRALVPTPGVGGAEYVGALGSSPFPPPVNFPCRAGTDLMLQSGSQVTEGTHFRNYRRSTMNAACPSCRSDDQPGEDPSPTPSARYKRCPKCQAMLRAVAEFCPHCGLSIPGNFPHKPLLAKDTLRIVSELREKIVPHRPTRAQAGARYVVLVACDRRDLLEYLRQKFATEVGIEVCYERRLGERRRRTAVSPGDRRSGDRRTRPPLDAELRRFGFAIVRTG